MQAITPGALPAEPRVTQPRARGTSKGPQRPSEQTGMQLESQSTKIAVLHSNEAAADSLFVGFPPKTAQGSRGADKAKKTCPRLAVKQGICFQQHIKGLRRSRKYIPLRAP